MGETRLWYSLFISITVLVLYLRWQYKFLLSFGALLASLFTIINIVQPEIHNTPLMPALQSVWFIPHVTIYMLAYAILAAAQIMALVAWKKGWHLMPQTDILVRVGSALILRGMRMGSVWAKQAWGNYWTWDIKENWAAITWLLYIAYIHLRRYYTHKYGYALLIISLAFIALQITWYGVNYLPAADSSLHIYGRS